MIGMAGTIKHATQSRINGRYASWQSWMQDVGLDSCARCGCLTDNGIDCRACEAEAKAKYVKERMTLVRTVEPKGESDFMSEIGGLRP